ncbi:DUF397 domain-containing protein [Streptomyces sp. H27-D2]|uniref:DUF397 domain-containing protein n=1 Tax=Streptomyces sp. H27-D2 TaxID=3046304 RepID=UPI002DBE4398|nr:DUF397 domain-containing protein [Streptomyces sp. H27-D2]MEC4016415.1 DUF397 domain-containing protein [Streptomyces sp. H27-D2]
MSDLTWQKTSYSEDQANCLYLAAAPDGTIRLRESDTPDAILTTSPNALRALMHDAKAGNLDHLTTR